MDIFEKLAEFSNETFRITVRESSAIQLPSSSQKETTNN